jgi:hypothetical protein
VFVLFVVAEVTPPALLKMQAPAGLFSSQIGERAARDGTTRGLIMDCVWMDGS